MKKIKVLHVINSMENGGMQSYLMTLLRFIDKERFQFDFLVYNNNSLYYDEIKQHGSHIYICPQNRNKFIKVLNRILYKKKLFHENQYDVIHVHIGTPTLPYLGVEELLWGPRFRVFHCHCSERKMSVLNRLLVGMCRHIMSRTYTDFIAVSEQAAKWGFCKRVLQNRQYVYLPDAINVAKFRWNEDAGNAVRATLGIKDKLVIGNIGRFTNQKNQSFLIDLVKNLRSQGIDCCLLLVGEGILDSQLRARAVEIGVNDNIFFYGTTKDVTSVLSAMDVFAFPSIFEGLGIVAIEAQANGLNVVASQFVPEEARVTDHYVVVPLQDTEKWSTTIVALAKQGHEPDFKKIESDIDRAGYSIASTIEKLSEFYENCVQHSSKGT